jgi:uncharacterized protein YjbI with pentapeptide repeats
VTADGRTCKAPQIEPLRLSGLAAGDPADLTRNAELESVRYADLILPELVLAGAKLDGVQFAGLVADETDLKGARLSEVHLDQANLPVVRAARSQWRDVHVTGRLGSVEAYEAQWRSVHFVGCKLSFVNLRGAELIDVAFTDCIIDELDLVGAAATRVRLSQTRVNHLNVRQAKLRDVDLRGATLEVIEGLTDLRGATISSLQLTLLAPLFADELGLTVED